MDVELEIETVRWVDGVGYVVRALGGAFHCWTDDPALGAMAEKLLGRPARLYLTVERVPGLDSGPKLVDLEALPIPPLPSQSHLKPLDSIRRRFVGRT